MMAPPASYLDLGEKYICPLWMFRRYDCFQRRLQDFLPRFQKIIENGGLTESFLNGPVMKKDIEQHSLEFSDTVSVYVLGHVNSLSLPDSLLVSNTKEPSVPSMKVDISEPMETDEPISIISNNRRVDSLPKLSQETSSWSDFKAAMSGASSYRTCFAVFGISNKQEEEEAISLSTQLTSYQRRNVLIFSTEDQKCYEFHNGSLQPTDLALAETIQRMLEVKIMALFDNIAQFLKKFRLKEGCRPDDRLYYAVDLGLRNSLMDEYTLLDIIPLVKDDSTEEEIKNKQTELDHNLTEFVKRKTKCILVLHFASEHGMSQDIVLEFFNDGYFVLDSKISEVLEDVSKPRLEEVKERGANRWKFREFVQSFTWKASKDLDKAQEYIQDKVQYFKKMGKLEFEMNGILQLSSVPIETEIPALPTISLECQCKILEMEEIWACGHLYGKLTLFVDKPLSIPSQTEIEFLLKEYKYTYGYISVESSSAKQGKCFGQIACGHLLCGQKQNANDPHNSYVSFSLGCFVNIKKLNESENTDLYAISCGHCLQDCIDEVYEGDNRAHFGQKTYLLNKYHFYDIAAIQVTKSVSEECTGLLYQSGRMNEVPWGIWRNNQPIVGQEVYKYGSKTNYTSGIVVSTDTILKDVAEKEKHECAKNAAEKSALLCQILVQPKEDGINRDVFSDEGDSGSVICMQDLDSNDVKVLALLIGAYQSKDENKYICSYGSCFAALIEELEKEHKIEITPACGSTANRQQT
ncbi:uncharacterized protein LOC127838912 [Dreissena polymorpha]|uniref:Uncharacterized protein n=1 Tax=Dreissena polymorpha TaxID=45954 RepID=A0A9D4RZR5_DREPO|nr:uncharacterized protein LOC127838912 [Dreissena polymorpha]KAH3885105.1 hypothetical protein DPMN_009094 [Dreissena polymorpha]